MKLTRRQLRQLILEQMGNAPTVEQTIEVIRGNPALLNDYTSVAMGEIDMMGGGLPAWLTQEFASNRMREIATTLFSGMTVKDLHRFIRDYMGKQGSFEASAL